MLGATLENEQHAVHRQVGGGFALVEFWAGQGVDVAGEGYADGVVDGVEDTRRWGGLSLNGAGKTASKNADSDKQTSGH